MIFVERYYKIHQVFLTVLGLWPYQTSKIWWIQIAFIFGVYSSTLFFQFTTFLTAECLDMEYIVAKLSNILPNVVYFLNYNCFLFNPEYIKLSLKHIRLDWKTLEDNNEMEILEKYSFIGFVSTLILSASFGLAMIVFTVFEGSPIIFDFVMPINGTRSRKITIATEFFLDQQQYFLWYLAHELAGLAVGVSSTIATGAFLAAIGQHCCGEYKIASNLIRGTVTDHTLRLPACRRTRFMYQNVCRAVYIHNRTMRFLNDLLFAFHLWYFPLLVIGVISLSCNLFRLFYAIQKFSKFDDLNELSISAAMLVGHLVYMFLGNFLGQLITDHSNEILKELYNTLWYVAPLPIQKLLLIMQKSIRSYKLVIGGFYVLCLPGFTTLATSSVSYLSVLYTMHT